MRIEYVVMGDRFTDEERQRLRDRLCTHQTGYGLPHIEYCGTRLSEAEMWLGAIECQVHEHDAETEGRPVLRLAYVQTAEDAGIGVRVARWDGSRFGKVAAILDGAVTVEWDDNPMPKVPGNKFTHFLPSGLEAGMLVRLPA